MKSKAAKAARMIYDFTGMTTRCYRNGKRTAIFASEHIPEDAADTFAPYLPDLRVIETPTGCITTPHGYYFGFIHYRDEYLIIGPVTDQEKTPETVSAIAARIDPSGSHRDLLLRALTDCPKMSIYSILSFLTGAYTMLSFRDDPKTGAFAPDLYSSMMDVTFYNTISDEAFLRQQSMESVFESIIENGDVKAMTEWFRGDPLFHFRVNITGDSLRDARDCFVLTTSLYSRAASRGGLDRGFSMQLLLNGIRAMESLTKETDILTLQSNMAIEFTREVAAAQSSPARTKLVNDAIRSIRRNIYGVLRVDDIAEELFVSRGYLSKMFHEETGQTISSFITEQKIGEAKRLLRFSNRKLSTISEMLRFSSQSHFTKAFKGYTGMTPKQYRDSLSKGVE